MSLLAFSIVTLFVGFDLRRRGFDAITTDAYEGVGIMSGYDAMAVGSWINLLGGIYLNIAVWRIF